MAGDVTKSVFIEPLPAADFKSRLELPSTAVKR